MKPARDIETLVRGLSRQKHAEAHDRILGHALEALRQRKRRQPAAAQPDTGRTVMNSPIAKLAAAALIIVAVVQGLIEFTGSNGGGVVWAEVARKVEANRGFTFHKRCRIVRPDRPEEVAYVVAYDGGSRLRQDYRLQPEGDLFKSEYYDFDASTYVSIRHGEKTSLHVPMREETLESRESGWFNTRDWVRQVVSSKCKRLGRSIIEGVQCEGIETTNPTFGDANPPAASMVARLWVSVETEYPVRLEVNATTRGDVQLEVLCERFHWDVELSPKLFEPNIPPDYRRRP